MAGVEVLQRAVQPDGAVTLQDVSSSYALPTRYATDAITVEPVATERTVDAAAER